MRMYGQVLTPANLVLRTVESADPADLADQVNVILAANDTLAVAGIDLAGTGDGHTFVATIAMAPANEVIGSPVASATGVTQVRCALAGTGASLLTSLESIATPTTPTTAGAYTLFDQISAGAGKGTRVMTMQVFTGLALATFAGKLSGLAAYRGGATPLLGAANILAFDTLVFAGGLTLPSPQFLQNPGPSIIANVSAGVVARVTGGGTMTVEVVKDPLGTPVSQGIQDIALAANVYAAVTVEALVALTPFSVTPAGSKVGVRVTLSGAGELLSAQLKAVQY